MPKHYKDMIDELINKMDEDAPANAVAHGGVDMNPTGKKVKKKDDAEDVLRRTIMKKLGANVKEGYDNNNVVLKGVNETLSKLEDKIDEKNGVTKDELPCKSNTIIFHSPKSDSNMDCKSLMTFEFL